MDVRKGKYILPNLFTIGGIFFGVLAILASTGGTPEAFRMASIAIIAAIVADSLDGRVARATRTTSRFGIQLDSLADVISFGVAPAVLAYSVIVGPPWTWEDSFASHPKALVSLVLAFLFVTCGALRLARFNLMAEQAKRPSPWFLGLPIPAAAGVVATLAWVASDFSWSEGARATAMLVALPPLSLAMVSTIRYPSFKRIRWRPWSRLAFVFASAVLTWTALRTKASVVLLAVAFAYSLSGPLGYAVRLALGRRRLLDEEE